MRVKSHLQATVDRVLTAPYQFDYYGMERGGHHAVLEWILAGAPQPASSLQRAHSREPLLRRNHPNGFLTPDVRWPVALAFTYGRDAPISKRDGYPIIVCVRDARNMVASRLRWEEDGKAPLGEGIEASLPRWEEYTRYALANPHQAIVYDRWFALPAYRATCAANIRSFIPTWVEDPTSLATVASQGYGSSFDGLDYQGRAQEMGVLTRWHAYKDNEVFKRLLTPAILDLNSQVLGSVYA
jgi:hypothetical protein